MVTTVDQTVWRGPRTKRANIEPAREGPVSLFFYLSFKDPLTGPMFDSGGLPRRSSFLVLLQSLLASVFLSFSPRGVPPPKKNAQTQHKTDSQRGGSPPTPLKNKGGDQKTNREAEPSPATEVRLRPGAALRGQRLLLFQALD